MNHTGQENEIAIIGGNISGISTAFGLIKKSIPVQLYETAIWDKPCGGGFGRNFARMLSDIGVNIPVRYTNDLIIATAYKKVEVRIPLAIASRRKLQEALLAVLGKNNGVTINLGQKLDFSKDFDKFQKINVVAAGVSGFSRQALSKSLNDVGTFQYQLLNASNSLEDFDATIFYFLPRLKGYAWLFPAPEGKVDIGVGGLTKTTTADRNLELAKFVRWCNRTYDLDINAKAKSRSWGIPIPISKPGKIVHKLGGKTFVGVGDAIELPDPVTAAGIESAWASGQLVAEAIKSGDKIDLLAYSNYLHEDLRKRKLVSRIGAIHARISRHRLIFHLLFPLIPGQILNQLYSTLET